MADYPCYLDLAALKSALTLTDTMDDTRLLDGLLDVSAFIDQHCGQRFTAHTATRTFTAVASDHLLLPYPLLSVTTLKTDDDADWDYDSTWATSDYHLAPFNVFPKWRILTKSGGAYSFPSQEEGVQIAGLWGFGDGESATPYAASGATVTVATTTGTSITASSGAAFAVGQTILAGTEQMFITGIVTNTLTVVRNVNGTTATVHAAAAASIYRYPRPVRRACLLLAEQMYRMEAAPLGVSGSADMAYETLNPAQQRLILHWLAPFRSLSCG